MRFSARTEALARLSLLGVTLLTSVYSLLCYIPFTWKQFIASRFYPAWFDIFLRFHFFFFWAALLPCLWDLRQAIPETGRSRRRRAWLALELIMGAAATALPLTQVGNDSWALSLSLLAWGPLIVWELALALERLPKLSWRTGPSSQTGRLFLAAIASALYIFMIYSVSSLLGSDSAPVGFGAKLALGWSLLAHLMVFLGVFTAVSAIEAFASLFDPSAASSSLLLFLAFAGALYFVVDHFLLAALTFNGPASAAVALCWAIGIAAALFGQSVALHLRKPSEDSLEFLGSAPSALMGSLATRPAGRAAFLGLAALAPALAHRLLATQDWNGLVETLFTILLWFFCFIFFQKSLKPAGRAAKPSYAWAAVLLTLAAAWAAQSGLSASDNDLRLGGVNIRAELRRMAERNVSYRTACRTFARAPSGSDFYQFLQRNTNLSREINIAPAEVRLAGDFGPSLARRPNILIFIVDSLRQDYIGAYNPQVHFTPAIDTFAGENLVWKQAFTAYGATGLSQPSIWAGSLLIHKQYVTPFHPMNSLEKLLDHENYPRFITMDPVLTTLLEPSALADPLDAHTSGNYEFCATLGELQDRLSKRQSSTPFFAYTQPQDIHISVLNRAGNNNVTGHDYPGFYAPYASRVEKMDRCFGGFISELKRMGLYENSIIILAADHGDALGEGGRWGHAYTLFPEILRVPLIMHVPEPLLKGRYRDLEAPAFLIDIAPTLYALFGHGPINSNELYGRSLLAGNRQEFEAASKPDQLLASSYGPVYGLLRDHGRYLYIVDAINFASHYYDLSRDPKGNQDLVDGQVTQQANAEIRRRIESISRFYKYEP